MTQQSMIELRNICRSYQEGSSERVVLRDVNTTIYRGELVVLLGRSGSGKSTLLNIISGIDQPSAGTVTVDGVELSGLSEQRRTLFRRKTIGFIFQFFNLIPTLTVEENLLLPLDLNGRLTKQTREQALSLLAEVGLRDRTGSFPDQLSGGEQQRVAIARAIAHDPPLVLADEPTGNLDAHTGEHVLGILDRMTRQAGKTLVMVTHSREVAAIADRVLRVEEGQLVEQPLEVLR